MFCSKCGAKNKEGAKFCEKCGNKLEENTAKGKSKVVKNNNNNTNQAIAKINAIPKKVKIGLGVGIGILVVAIIVLAVLLSNPVKKVEDYLTDYYNNYTEDYKNRELVKVEEIIKSHMNDKKDLENISNQIEKTIKNWVKNFNKSYKNEDDLNKAYQKISNVLEEINSYFKGLEYVLTSEDYYNYREELYDLYYSKSYYFSAKEASSDSEKYYNYSKVIESDSYYKEAQEFINNYLADELESIKADANNIVALDEGATTEQFLNAYIEQLEFLEDNQYKNGIDLSATSDYQTLYQNAVDKIVEYTKAYASELEANYETNEVMDMIDKSMDVLEYDSDEYNELDDLKASYEDKLPSKLTEEYDVSHTSGSGNYSYGTTINDEKYDSYISFRFEGETQSRVYRLNNEYKQLKTTIVRGPNWDADFTGEIVIYGDGKELYRSGEITKTNEIDFEVNIDVTDVDDLKIEFVTESEPDGWASFYIYLVEPYLYK